jgi:tetratricopeptide (TPR) repeat protein
VLVALLHFFTATSLLILIVVPYFTVFSFVSDHWQYFGCMSVIALAATGMVRSLERVAGQNRPAQWLACGCLLLVLGVLTWRQSGMYVNAETLWTTTLERNPQSAEAHNRYGDILFQKGEVDAALSQFETSVALETNDPESHYNLGSALAEKGRLDEATTQFGESLRIDPSSSLAHNGLGKVLAATSNYDGAISEYQKALAARPAFAEAELNWGTALMKEGHPDEAMPKFLRAIEISPTNFAARINLGGLLAKSDHLDGAVSQFQQAVAINPTNALARVDLGTALYQSGLTNEAIRQLEAAAQIEPGNYGVRINLGSLLYQQHRLDEAINQFKAACELRPDLAPGRERLNRIAWILATSPVAEVRDGTKSLALAEELARLTGGTDPAVLATLAAALAETGNLTDAFATAQRASDLATQQGNQAVADGLVAQLDDYRAGRPYRDHATPFTTPTPPPAAATH